MKKKRKPEPERKKMKCGVCDECYERYPGSGNCDFGGPFSGYVWVEEPPASVVIQSNF